MKLVGINHVTLPPHLLEQLSNLPASAPSAESLFLDNPKELPVVSATSLYEKESFMKATERRHHKLSEVSTMDCR